MLVAVPKALAPGVAVEAGPDSQEGRGRGICWEARDGKEGEGARKAEDGAWEGGGGGRVE